MMEHLLCAVCGLLLGLLIKDELKLPAVKRKPTEKARDPTEWEERKAKRELKERVNFMTYDGSPQDDIID